MPEEVDLKNSQHSQELDNPFFLQEVGAYLQSKGVKTVADIELLFEPNFYVIIPLAILEREDISPTSKILYGEISALSRKSGRCFATNAYISERLGIGERTISRSVQELAGKGLIILKISRTKKGTYRNLHLSYAEEGGGRQNGEGGSPKWRGGVAKMASQKRNRQREIDKEKDTATASVAGSKSTFNPLGAEIIKAFEGVDAKNKTYYSNKTQRAACDFLIAEYGLEDVKKRISVLPKTNKLSYFPTITTPYELKEKWVKLEDAVARKRSEENKPSRDKPNYIL